MEKNIIWLNDNRISIDSPKRTKKITGTRFATILGLNPWSTPFEIWCAVTKTYEEPFEDTKYTIAGKIIEPKQADYLKKLGLKIKTPTDVYGEDYFHKTWGDFYRDIKVLGGMWDYLGLDENGNVDTVYEMKTTKRIEDWKDGKAPTYYALQASLYAYLLGIDHVVMVGSFLKESDYEHPENYEPNYSNTIFDEFNIYDRFPDFLQKVADVLQWWNEHVETGISPTYDEKKDAKILKELRKHSIEPGTDISEFIKEADRLKSNIETVKNSISEDEKRLKEITKLLKQEATSQFRDGDNQVAIKGKKYTWILSKSEKLELDKEKLEADGLLEKYLKPTTTFRFIAKENT